MLATLAFVGAMAGLAGFRSWVVRRAALASGSSRVVLLTALALLHLGVMKTSPLVGGVLATLESTSADRDWSNTLSVSRTTSLAPAYTGMDHSHRSSRDRRPLATPYHFPRNLSDVVVVIAFVLTCQAAACRTQALDGVAWFGWFYLLAIAVGPIVASLMIFPAIVVGFFLPPLAATGPRQPCAAFDAIAGGVVATIVLAFPHHVAGRYGGGFFLVAVLLMGPTLRSLLATEGSRTERLRIIWPLLALWLYLHERAGEVFTLSHVTQSLPLLLLITAGARLIAYRWPVVTADEFSPGEASMTTTSPHATREPA